MPDPETPIEAAADTSPAQPAQDLASGGSDLEARYQQAMAAAMAEASDPPPSDEGGEQPTDEQPASTTDDQATASPGDNSAGDQPVSEAPAEATGTETPAGDDGKPPIRFEDLSRSQKAALLAEIRPLMQELQSENEKLRTEREQTEAQQKAAAKGRYEFFGMDENGTDAPYLEIVKRAEEGDWDAIQQRKVIEKNRRFGFDVIQQANDGAWAQLEAQLQAVKSIPGVNADAALATKDLSKVIAAVAEGVAARERGTWATEKAALEKAHKAEVAKLQQEHKTKLARAMGELPSPESAGTPGAAPGLLSRVLRADAATQDDFIERAKRGEFASLALAD